MFSYLKKLIFGVHEPEEKPLNLYQYKFLRYKEERDSKYPLDLTKVHVPEVKDLVSVVLPVYNGGDILKDSIESVLAQTYANFELIIINDGSKDQTLEIAKSMAETDSRIRVLTQENKKIPRTLSRGFREAKGEFLTWTSADNVMDPDFLEKMVGELKENPQTAMVWANMRLINAKGKKYSKHGWFEYPIGSGNVIFPHNAFELNTYANNTIGAAFMYRKAAAEILDCYSSYKHTLEDYDYWMRMNSLLDLRHTSFVKPVYSYRWHDGSLTAKDKELGITKNRYKLMVFDDFRRDFYLTPLLWYLNYDENNIDIAQEFKKQLEKAGHVILSKEDFAELFFGESPSNMIYASFGGVDSDVILPQDAIKVGVNTEKSENFDFVVALPEYKQQGFDGYVLDDIETMFSFIDAKAKNSMLYSIEGRLQGEEEYKKKLSVVVCTHKMSQTLKECMDALCNQNASAEDYEIVFVNNNIRETVLKEYVMSLSKEHPELKINYITAPLKGLSFARNSGMWSAQGEVILYVDDDSIASPDLITETIKAFEGRPELGTCGGQVVLTVPDEAKDLVNDQTIGLWSNLKIEGKGFRYAKDYGEFPYGANFAVIRDCLRMIGGFRCNYGRVGNNYAGGEETLVCFMMDEIHMKVGLNADSVVEHRVDPERFNMQHIEKTACSGIMTQYRLRRDLYAPQDWNDVNVRERAIKAEKAAKAEPLGSATQTLYSATAKAFRDVLVARQNDYEFLIKNKSK
ncbi:MAG: glycosyltransferase [Clostridia bacterium]|nr:glycosyltransferase [Clostridia bacterium]